MPHYRSRILKNIMSDEKQKLYIKAYHKLHKIRDKKKIFKEDSGMEGWELSYLGIKLRITLAFSLVTMQIGRVE